MLNNPAGPQTLSEATAIRLYTSVLAANHERRMAASTAVVATGLNSPSINSNSLNVNRNSTTNAAPTTLNSPGSLSGIGIEAALEQKSIDSIRSCNEFGNSCRICRWNRSDMQILQCPCHCKGSVGFIHLQCLKRWIMHRRDNRCEICNARFELPSEQINLKRMLHTFCTRCLGSILKHMIYSASLIPLAHVILQQVLFCMENINRATHDDVSVVDVMIASCALLTSSALFFHFFEFITTRFLLIRNILRQWWVFGNTNDFPLIDLNSDIFEFI